MESLTVRINKRAHDSLRELSKACEEPMTEILDKAIESYRQRRFLENLNASYAALRQSPAIWDELAEDRRAWDATLGDGMNLE